MAVSDGLVSYARLAELRRVGTPYPDWSGRSRTPHNGDTIVELADALEAERDARKMTERACATLLLHLQNYQQGASVKKAQRLGMAQTFAIATLAGSPDPLEQVRVDWSDASGQLVIIFETVSVRS